MRNHISKIEKIIKAACQNKSSTKWEDLGKLSQREICSIKDATGIDLEGYKRVLTVQDVNHAINRHGEYSGDKCPIEYSDFLLIPLIVNNYDKISKGHISKSTNLQCIVYEKKIGDKYFYIEEIRTGRKKVALKTLYKKKKPVK